MDGTSQTLMHPSIPAVNKSDEFLLELPAALFSEGPVTANSGPVCPLSVKYGSKFPSFSAYLLSMSCMFHSFTIQSSEMDASVSIWGTK